MSKEIVLVKHLIAEEERSALLKRMLIHSNCIVLNLYPTYITVSLLQIFTNTLFAYTRRKQILPSSKIELTVQFSPDPLR